MTKPIFMFEGLEAALLSASGGSDPNYPLQNLKDRDYSTQWISASMINSQHLDVVYQYPTSGKPFDSVLILNHLFKTIGVDAVEIRCSNDNFQNDNVLAATVNISSDDPIFASFQLHTKPYIRITLATQLQQFDDYPAIGMIFIGKKVELQYNVVRDKAKYGLDSESVEIDTSLSGKRYASSLYGEREAWKVGLMGLKSAEKAEMFRLLKGIQGRFYPFCFRDSNGIWHVVRLKKNLLFAENTSQLYDDLEELEFDEERVGISPW